MRLDEIAYVSQPSCEQPVWMTPTYAMRCGACPSCNEAARGAKAAPRQDASAASGEPVARETTPPTVASEQTPQSAATAIAPTRKEGDTR